MKTLKVLIVSEEPLNIKRQAQFEQSRLIQEKYGFGQVKVEYTYQVIPKFLDGVKIEKGSDLDENWIQEKVKNYLYHIIHVDMTPEKWDSLGLRSDLYGQSQVVKTEIGKQAIQYGRWNDSIGSRVLRYLPLYLRKAISSLGIGVWHETFHSLCGLLGITDTAHYHFYGLGKTGKRYERTPDPDSGWSKLPFHKLEDVETLKKWHVSNLLKQVEKLKSAMQTDLSFLPSHWLYVSQVYGVPNKAYYPLTGHHIGTDFATPEGTQIIAPRELIVTRTGFLPKSLGNWCEVKIGEFYLIFCHLKEQPKIGTRKRGAVIALTGNTGFTKGVHLHLELWYAPMDRNLLTSKNWNVLTGDVTKYFN